MAVQPPLLPLLARTAGLCLALALSVPDAEAAPRDASVRLDRATSDINDVQARMDRLAREYGQRRGLIGAEEAILRYENAVYAYLLGEYERAALSFYTLVRSDALTTGALQADSEWYLAECVFEMGNWNTALDAYGRIMKAGESHPFFADAVRRTLEVHGILGNSEEFSRMYRQWVLSNRVPSTDVIKYTVAKSFFRQGELARAKAMFQEIPPKSSQFARARYFNGALLAAEGDLVGAREEFKLSVGAENSTEEVRQQAWLALGRVHYELEEHSEAVSAYQKLPGNSPFFADQLYELTWTYIKQGAWREALDNVEIFIVAFPEHRYTLKMKLYQGHLHRKAGEFERALASYEDVVDDYTPVRSLISEWEADREKPAAFFERLVEDGASDVGIGSRSLPEYAVQLLREERNFDRVVVASKELGAQSGDLTAARNTVAEVRSVLASSGDSVGTFNRGRAGLQRVRDDALTLRIRLLRTEMELLENEGGDAVKAQLSEARMNLESASLRMQVVQGAESSRSDRYRTFEDQVRVVQGEAGRVAQVVTLGQGELAAVDRLLDQRRNQMSAEAADQVGKALRQVSEELEAVQQGLASAQSDTTLRTVMASVPAARHDNADEERGGIGAELDLIHRSLRAPRGSVGADAAGSFAQVDQQWMRLTDLDARAVQTGTVLDEAEKVEVALLRTELEQQDGLVLELNSEVTRAEMGAEALAVNITRWGLGKLENTLYETILNADMGIVDVYWLRKTEVVDERTRLQGERADRLSELDARFGLIRQKLED